MRSVSFTLNGASTTVTADDTRTLLWVLRDDLNLTGTKFGCGVAQCGSCTVILEKRAVRACMTTLKDVEGKSVMTIEGVMRNNRLHAVQEAFVKHAALQCGYCTPGMVMEAYAFLLNHPRATREDIINEFEGHACRCGAHVRIMAAIEELLVAAARP